MTHKPPLAKRIFVFGSNLAGRHGAGSALEAKRHHGAATGVGVGLCNNSYAIPTKDHNLVTLRLDQIELYVTKFINFAREHKELQFDVVAIGCGLAGYKPKDIAPMFTNSPTNVKLPKEFKDVIAARMRTGVADDTAPSTTLVTDNEPNDH